MMWDIVFLLCTGISLVVTQDALTEADAVIKCNAMGWTVGPKTDKSLICTAPGRSAGSNCANGRELCDTWRLLVWSDGGKEYFCRNYGHTYLTKAGRSYSAHDPCVCGWNLHECPGSNWFEDISPSPTVSTTVCTSVPIDIVFIMDSSGSVGSYYQTEKNFVKFLANAFNVTQDGAHVGVAIFSDLAEISIRLDEYYDAPSFNAAVDNIRFISSGTRIDLGLRTGQTMFTQGNGGRLGTERLMILLTDGQTSGDDPIPIGQEIRRLGIGLVAIGIGNNINHAQLTSMSGGAENYFTAANFNELASQNFVDKMTQASCKTIYLPAPDGRSYKLHEKPESWDDSLTQCENEGGHMAVSDSDETIDLLRKNYGSVTMWLGAKFDNGLNQWIWIDGQPIDNSFWGGEPPMGNNLCLATNHGGNPGTVNGTSCDQSLPFMCQKGASRPKEPIVTCYAVGNRIQCHCQIFYKNYTLQTLTEVTWFQLTTSGIETEIYTETLSGGDSWLQNDYSRRYFVMGRFIFAKVRVWFVNQPHVRSAYATSEKVFLGIQFGTSLLTIREGGSPVQVKVSLQTPLLCADGVSDCSVTVDLKPTNKFTFSPCFLEFHSGTSNETTFTVTISTINDYVDDGVQKITVTPSFTLVNVSDDWANMTGTFEISRVSTSTGRCSSTGDPHIRTFDGAYFHHYRVGTYVLVESISRQFQVHAQTHRCGSVSCNCGVAAREGNDVLTVNSCYRTSPQVHYRSDKEPEPGTFIEQSNNGKDYILRFKSGAFVRFHARGSYANIYVQLPPDDFNNTRGLCGLIDKNPANDMTDRTGIWRGNCGGQACATFSESWKVSEEENLFYYTGGEKQCLPPVNMAQARCLPTNNVRTQVTSGYRKMVYSGQMECEDGRGEEVISEVIVTEPPTDPIFGGPIEDDQPSFDPVVPTFPTNSGTTETQANNYCRDRIEASATHIACKRAIGVSFEISGYVEQCVEDIKILDDMHVALESAIGAMASDCEETVISDPTTWVPGGGGNKQPPSDIFDSMCPSDCSGRGNCSQKVCTCDAGYTTDDCSVAEDAIPSLEEIPGGILCDIRSKVCSSAKVSGKDLIPGNVVCGFDESQRFSGGGFIQRPSSETISFSEVKCELPTEKGVVAEGYLSQTVGIPTQTYMIHLSNNGQNFSTNSLPFIVYDSRCMKCNDASGDSPKTCILRENTCMINGYCFLANEADPEDPECKVCDPVRSTSKFVYKKGTLSGNVLKCRDRYTLDCHELYVTSIWEKDMFGADALELKLKDPTCNTYESNSTHIWVKVYFNGCGSEQSSTTDIIIQENTATIRLTYIWQNVVERTVYYQYRMQCIFDRKVNVSTANYYEVIYDLDGNLFANQSGRIEFNATMDIYTSDSFLAIANPPLSVTSFQPIFVGIKEAHSNELFRFVVNQCYATPEASGKSNTQYTFFDSRCALDDSFAVLSRSDNHFNYKIDAFTFIQVRLSVYFHCKLYICPVNDTSPECTQECGAPDFGPSRKRRSLGGESEPIGRHRRSTEGPVRTIDIRSEQIKFKRVKRCEDMTCPKNSHCMELYPAECRCNAEYVMHKERKECVNENVLEVKGIHIEDQFINSYSNTSSYDFMKLASKVEKDLLTVFQKEDDNIDGVKLLSARAGSIVLDILVTYGKAVTVEEAEKSFVKAVMSAKNKTTTLLPGSILSKVIPKFTPTFWKRVNNEVVPKKDNIVLIAAAVAGTLVAVIVILSVVSVKVCRRTKVVIENDGVVNAGVDNEGLHIEMGNRKS